MGCTLTKKQRLQRETPKQANESDKVLNVKPSNHMEEVENDHHHHEKHQNEMRKEREDNKKPFEVHVPSHNHSMNRTQSLSQRRKDVESLPRSMEKSRSTKKRSTSFNRRQKSKEKGDVSRSTPRLEIDRNPHREEEKEEKKEKEKEKKYIMSMSLVPKKDQQKSLFNNQKATPAPSMLNMIDEERGGERGAREREREREERGYKKEGQSAHPPPPSTRCSPRTDKEELRARWSPQRELQRTPRHQSTPPKEREQREEIRLHRNQANVNDGIVAGLIAPLPPSHIHQLKPILEEALPRESPDEAMDWLRLEQNIRERMHARHRTRHIPIDPEEDTLFEVPPRMPVIDLVRI